MINSKRVRCVRCVFNLFILAVLAAVVYTLLPLDPDHIAENRTLYIGSFSFTLLFFFVGNSFIEKYFHVMRH